MRLAMALVLVLALATNAMEDPASDVITNVSRNIRKFCHLATSPEKYIAYYSITRPTFGCNKIKLRLLKGN